MDKPSPIDLSVKLAEARKAIKEAETRHRREIEQLGEKSLAIQEELREVAKAHWAGISDSTPSVVIHADSGQPAVLLRTNDGLRVMYEDGKSVLYTDASRFWMERSFVFLAKLDEVFLYTMDRKYGVRP